MKRITEINLLRVELFVLNNLVWFILVGFFLVMGLFIPVGWFTLTNIDLILFVSAPLAVVAFAEAIIIIAGGIDVSLTEIVGLAAVLTGVVIVYHITVLPGFVSILMIAGIGALLGMINGFFIGKTKLSPILVTIATYLIYLWMTRFIMTGTIQSSQLPSILLYPGSGILFGFLRVPILIFVIVFLLLHILMNYTSFGNKIYAVGGNPASSEMLGISVGKTHFWAYTLAGALGGLAALIWIGFVGSIPPTLADGRIFSIFASVFVGGVAMTGGRGSLFGVLGGVLLLSTFSAGLTMLATNPMLREALMGVVMLIAIIINKIRERLIDKILLPK